jgi:hypothetical protein
VGHGVAAELGGEADQLVGDEGAPQRRGQEIAALVAGVGLQGRQDEVLHEAFAQVADMGCAGPGLQGVVAQGPQVLPVAQVGGEGDDLVALLLDQPRNGKRGVEAAGVGEEDAAHREGV